MSVILILCGDLDAKSRMSYVLLTDELGFPHVRISGSSFLDGTQFPILVVRERLTVVKAMERDSGLLARCRRGVDFLRGLTTEAEDSAAQPGREPSVTAGTLTGDNLVITSLSSRLIANVLHACPQLCVYRHVGSFKYASKINGRATSPRALVVN